MAAALQTNELLHLIISEVPREFRTSLRRVSKAWQAAVEKIGHAFEPEGYAVCEGQGPCCCPLSPLYASHIAFRIHPALYATGLGYGDLRVKTCVGASHTDYHRLIWLERVRAGFGGGSDIARFAGNEQEFITSPPVTEVTTSELWRHPTILRVSGGVQFRHWVEHLLKVTQVGSMQFACVKFATQLPNVEPKSELRDYSSEEEDEEESDEHSESDEVEDSDGEDSEHGAGSSSDSESGSEKGDSTSGENDQVEGSSAVMDAVMQTNKLLHLIIGEVPVEHRTSIRRVAKAWQAAVVKIGHALQPVAYNEQNQPLYSVSKTFAVNDSNPAITCYRNSRDEINGFQFNPGHLSENPKIAERLCEFLTDPPVTHVKLSCYTKRREIQAILRVHGGIRIRDLVEIFGKMKPKGPQKGEYAYIATQDLDDEGNVIVKPVEPPAEDDSSDSGDESVSDDSGRWYRPESDDSDDPDEPDPGAGGAGLPDSGKPGDSDGDNLSDDAGGSSESDDCSEVGDSKPDEDEQVEESSAAAVLDTNELLHMILSEVPREHRVSLRRISKNWQAAVEKIGYVFQPADHSQGHHQDDPRPLYVSQPIFRSNPVFLDNLFSMGRPAHQAIPGYRIECRSLGSSRSAPHWVSVAKLKENGHQFITDPPLTELQVRTRGILDPKVRLQVYGGIRLKDLLEFFQTVHRRGEFDLFFWMLRRSQGILSKPA